MLNIIRYLSASCCRALLECNVMRTRKRGNCECIATWGRPTLLQYFPAFITTPCQVWSRWTYPLAYYSVFCWYITLRCDLDLWPFTLNICNVSPVTCASKNVRSVENACHTWAPYRGVDEIYIPIIEALPTTKPQKYI